MGTDARTRRAGCAAGCGSTFATHTGGLSDGATTAGNPAVPRGPRLPRAAEHGHAAASGLNLQNASVVINCDQPWNPARLEQRIARAWRKDQTSAVTVLNLVSERTVEHRMLATLADKQAHSVKACIDQRGDLNAIKMVNGRENFLQRLETLLPPIFTDDKRASSRRKKNGPSRARGPPLPTIAATPPAVAADAPRVRSA